MKEECGRVWKAAKGVVACSFKVVHFCTTEALTGVVYSDAASTEYCGGFCSVGARFTGKLPEVRVPRDP